MRKLFCLPLGIVALLCGCSTDINPPPAPNALAAGTVIGAVGMGAAGSSIVAAPVAAWFGALTGATIGHNIDKQMSLLKEIQDAGVKVILVGDAVKIILPADNFFMANASSFNTYSFAVLNKIVVFLRQYPNLSIKVSGYTDNRGTSERNLALSKQWADLIAEYLWQHGVDTRLLYAAGYGECDTIASNKTPYGRAANRRVEISLYRVPSRSF